MVIIAQQILKNMGRDNLIDNIKFPIWSITFICKLDRKNIGFLITVVPNGLIFYR